MHQRKTIVIGKINGAAERVRIKVKKFRVAGMLFPISIITENTTNNSKTISIPKADKSIPDIA